MEDVTCRVPLGDLVRCQGAADRAFKDLVAHIGNPKLRPQVAAQTRAAAASVRTRCEEEHDELGGVEFRLRVMFIDEAFGQEDSDSDAEDDDDEYGSDMEFGEFDLSGARSLHGQRSVVGYEDDDDDEEDGCGAQFSVRPYSHGALVRGQETTLLLSGFEARSNGPELTDQDELTSYDIQRVVRKALEMDGGGSVEDDEAYQRALAGGAPVSRASRATMVDQALQSVRQQQQSKSPSPIFPMRTGF